MKNTFIVLTACYNKAKFIDDAVLSILQQDYRPLSVVWVDDCSTDGSLKRLMKHTKKFKRENIGITVISNETRVGCSSSYCIAVNHVTDGMFFGILDADDMLVKNSVSFIVSRYLSNPKITYIWTQFSICNLKMEHIKRGISKAPDPGKSLLDMGLDHCFSHWRTFSNRIDIRKIFVPGINAAVDKYMGYRLEELGPGMFIDKLCYLYREGIQTAITRKEPTKDWWRRVMKTARHRRINDNIRPFPIYTEGSL